MKGKEERKDQPHWHILRMFRNVNFSELETVDSANNVF
jgi:hypothetical protein